MYTLTGDRQVDAQLSRKPGPRHKMEELEPLTVRDVLLLCDLFYLPYEYGPRALTMLSDAHWTLSNLCHLQNCRNVPPGEQVSFSSILFQYSLVSL